MNIQIDIDEYSPENGLTLEVPGGKVRMKHLSEDCCSIYGDKDGLTSLAIALLTVAQNIGKAHPGAHIHVDEHPLLDAGSSSFVIGQLIDTD